MKPYALLIFFFCLGTVLTVAAQPPVPLEPTVLDTFKMISGDTVEVERSESGVDTVVEYSAQEIDFDVVRRVTVLVGDAVITYKDMRLEAARIEVDWDRQIMTASGLPDTLWADSAQTEIDSIVQRGKPHFTQGQDDFYGDEIAYNMKTRIGRVRGGSTTYEDGYYYGRQFKRISEDVILVRKGSFTTCDLDEPHYHFGSNELKVVVGRRVIARPVILHFADVPVMAAPYGIFPQQHGRTSGLLIPTFGESTSQGRFLRGMGYYWATSEYADVRGSLDFYERIGFLGRVGFRYNKIYVLNGYTDVDFNLSREGGLKHRDYSVVSSHNHTIDPHTRLVVSGAYYSSNEYVQRTGSAEELVNQSVRSSANFSRNWENSPWSLGVNGTYTQNLRQKTWSATVPGITLNHRSGQVFPPAKAPRNIRGAVAPKELEPPWYRAFLWSYNSTYTNQMDYRIQRREEAVIPRFAPAPGHAGDSIRTFGTDTANVFQRDGLVHNFSLSANAKVLRYVSLVPRLGVNSLWTRRMVEYVPEDSLFRREDDRGFFQRTTFDLGSSATTKLYGLANRPFGIGASFRHTMTPSVSFTWRPDFSDQEWGYFRTVQLPDGRKLTYDRFRGEDQVAGSTPKGLSERFTFGLGHLFQMKTGSDEDENVKRYDLLTWTMGTGVDLRRDSLKWDNLGMSFRTSLPGRLVGPFQSFSLDVGTTHSLYEKVGGQRVNRFFWGSDQGGLLAPLELINADINVGFTIGAESVGDLFGFLQRAPVAEDDTAASSIEDSVAVPHNPLMNLDFLDSTPTLATRGGKGPSQFYEMPFTMQVSLRQNRNYETRQVTSSLATNSTFMLTRRWNVTFGYNFDLDRKEVRDTRVAVTRDLHCWEAAFQWNPLGINPGYFLRIGLKSPQLKDVKVERQRGSRFGGQYYGR